MSYLIQLRKNQTNSFGCVILKTKRGEASRWSVYQYQMMWRRSAFLRVRFKCDVGSVFAYHQDKLSLLSQYSETTYKKNLISLKKSSMKKSWSEILNDT